eukprot:TRINITY_DN4173_c0_g1_i1.p1 TRINITY_DN4173_c0_g1~~TRINITY_DN4173_c0_g1_i1.p1  ORF type:complete len:293 (-),score=87.42 TRINITY_DN4173_c0_g1_i1:120-998(-)
MATNPFDEGASSYSSNNNSYDSTYKEKELNQREADIIRREQELDRRERELVSREAQGGVVSKRPPNWPRCKPIVRQDLMEIENDGRRVVARLAWISWYSSIFLLLWNIVAMASILATRTAAGGDFVLAVIYLFLWLTLEFLVYRTLYNALRTGKALRYWLYFICGGINILAHIFAGIGLRGSGMGGLLWMIWLFANAHGSKVVNTAGILCLVDMILFFLWAVCATYIWIRTQRVYVRRGGNRAATAQAGQVAVNAAANNPDVVLEAGKYVASNPPASPKASLGAHHYSSSGY